MKLIAHITISNGIRIEQDLYEHCRNTARYASETLMGLNLENVAYTAGILHDMGKATEKFNTYLEASFAGENVKKGSVNHTFAGVIYILEKYHTSKNTFEMLTSEIIAYAIGSHHGMFDCTDLDGKNGFQYRLDKDWDSICYEEAKKNYFETVIQESEIENYFQKAVKEIENIFLKIKEDTDKKPERIHFQLGFVCRMILSAVIYGDRKDTGEFMRQCQYDNMTVNWNHQKVYLENKINQFDKSTAINQVRNDISLQCEEKARLAGGIYRLYVPTGAGKTLAALRYALTQVSMPDRNKKRIIFVIPLLSVLDQNAKVIRENISNQEIILEHHSNVVISQENKEVLDQYELLTDTWDAPIIITTLVQFLNVLFTDKTASIRRMNSLCNSVIVIDEVQSLPRKITAMFNMAMNFLSRYCNATIVLSSATQPCFEETKWPMILAENVDIVILTKEQKKVFERCKIINEVNPYGMSYEECIDFFRKIIEKHPSLLVICNTKKEAKIIFSKLQDCLDETVELFHLSTSMCQAHRENELKLIQEKLKVIQKKANAGQTCRKMICISTQLVEAGVDFSFSAVVRLIAGIDNLAQAAGRCNRSNEYDDGGQVYLIKLKKENLQNLPDILQNQKATERVLEDADQNGENSLISEKMVKKYYQYLYQEIGRKQEYPVKDPEDVSHTLYLAQLLSNQNPGKTDGNYFFHQPFKTVGSIFKVFDNETIDILVPYKEGWELIERIESIDESEFKYLDFSELENLFSQMKKYTVSIFEWQRKKLEENGMLMSYFDGRVWVLDERAYHEKYGLDEEKEQSVEDYIL